VAGGLPHLLSGQFEEEVAFMQKQLILPRQLCIFKGQKSIRSIIFHLSKDHISLNICIRATRFQHNRDFSIAEVFHISVYMTLISFSFSLQKQDKIMDYTMVLENNELFVIYPSPSSQN